MYGMLKVSEETHRKIKVLASAQRMTINAYIEWLIEEEEEIFQCVLDIKNKFKKEENKNLTVGEVLKKKKNEIS